MVVLIALGCIAGAAAGLALSAYQYTGPLDYVALPAMVGLVVLNVLVGGVFGVVGALVWRRRGGLLFLAGFAVCATLVVAWGEWNVRDDVNVLVLVSDAVRADHVGAYGYERETTPVWDAVGSGDGGVVFETAVAQGTMTISGGPAVMTGLYQSQTGYIDNEYVLPPAVETLAERAWRLGCKNTAGFVPNPHLSGERGFSQGFSVYEDTLQWGQRRYATSLADAFSRWHESEASGRWFSLLFFIDTHMVYQGETNDVLGFRPAYHPVDWSKRPFRHLPANEQEDMIALYDASLRSVGRACNTVLETLERAGDLDRTLVVITSDHGEQFWERGDTGHGWPPYEDQVRVPLIIRFPSPVRLPRIRPVAHVCEHPAAQVDIAPTIVDVLGGPPSDDLPGESLLPYAFGRMPPNPERGLLSVHLRPEYDCLGWRQGRYELLETRSRGTGMSDEVNLYDLADARPEQRNIAGREPDIVSSMRKQMHRELERGPFYAQQAGRQELSPEATEALKALGYLD